MSYLSERVYYTELSCSCIFLHRIPLSSSIYIQLFLNINRDVSALVKFATRSWLVSYVGKVVAPGDWHNIIQNIIYRGREGKSFYDIHKSCHFGYIRSTNNLAHLPVPNSKIEFYFDFAVYKLC